MWSVGGARVGLAACLVVGCASAWKPPPEPPPPPPAAETPSKYNPFRGLEWNASTRTIGCGPTDFTVPADLAAHVRMNGPSELTIVPAGSPPGSALMARVHDPRAESEVSDIEGGFVGLFVWVVEKAMEQVTLGHEFMAMMRLYAMANGQSLEDLANAQDTQPGRDDTVEVTMKDALVEITYVHREETWRLFGVDTDRCVIMTIERAFPHVTHPFADIKEQMRVAGKSAQLARGY
jgi:hypothetical protein